MVVQCSVQRCLTAVRDFLKKKNQKGYPSHQGKKRGLHTLTGSKHSQPIDHIFPTASVIFQTLSSTRRPPAHLKLPKTSLIFSLLYSLQETPMKLSFSHSASLEDMEWASTKPQTTSRSFPSQLLVATHPIWAHNNFLPPVTHMAHSPSTTPHAGWPVASSSRASSAAVTRSSSPAVPHVAALQASNMRAQAVAHADTMERLTRMEDVLREVLRLSRCAEPPQPVMRHASTLTDEVPRTSPPPHSSPQPLSCPSNAKVNSTAPSAPSLGWLRCFVLVIAVLVWRLCLVRRR